MSPFPNGVTVATRVTFALHVRAFDGLGREITPAPAVRWSSTTPGLTVDSLGVVRTVDGGTGWVRVFAAGSVSPIGDSTLIVVVKPVIAPL